MPQKEGKSAYNLTGYVALCDYFNRMRPLGHQFGWMEGIFAQLFTQYQGRSDISGTAATESTSTSHQ